MPPSTGGLHNVLFFQNASRSITSINRFPWASNNTYGNPLFVDSASGDYRTLPGSAAIDAGDFNYTLGHDSFSNARPIGKAPDLGLHETEKEVPVVTWELPATIAYGTPLSGRELNGTANLPGTFIYQPALGSVLNAGKSQILTANFIPLDTIRYAVVATQFTIDVDPAMPEITWNEPLDIVYGLPLGGSQLNASSGHSTGVYSYDPPLGTVLEVGDDQPLHVTFTPDNENFAPTTKTVTIGVTPAPLTIVADNIQRSPGEENPLWSITYS